MTPPSYIVATPMPEPLMTDDLNLLASDSICPRYNSRPRGGGKIHLCENVPIHSHRRETQIHMG